MKTKLNMLLSSIKKLCACVMFLFGICSAINAAPQKISVYLTADKTNYVLGEPVVLTVVIAYSGESPLEVNNPLDEGDYRQKLDIAFEKQGKFERYLSWAEACDALKDRSKLLPKLRWEPGAKATNNLVLFCWWLNRGETNKLVFPKAGSYQVRYTVSLGDENFTNIITVAFTDPQNDTDQKAWQWLQTQNKNVLEEFGGLDHLLGVPEVRARVLGHLNELLTQNPESIHSKYIRLKLAEHGLQER